MFLAAEKNKMGQINHNPVQIGQQELALKMVILKMKIKCETNESSVQLGLPENSPWSNLFLSGWEAFALFLGMRIQVDLANCQSLWWSWAGMTNV